MITLHTFTIALSRCIHDLRATARLSLALALFGVSMCLSGTPAHAAEWSPAYRPTHQPAHISTQDSMTATGIQGQVWRDLNHDGIHQAQEPGIAGITVTLHLAQTSETAQTSADGLTQTVTSATGHYTFTNLESKTYVVAFQSPPTYAFTQFGLGPQGRDSLARANGQTDPITLEAGAMVQQVDAGLWKTAIVSDDSSTAEMKPIFLPMIANAPL